MGRATSYNRRMRSALVTAAILLTTSAAWAGKPTQTQAKKAATAWLKALELGDHAPDAKALGDLTATPFVSEAVHDSQKTCEAATTPTADKLGDVFDCLKDAVDEAAAKAKPRPYKHGDLGTQYDDQVKRIASIKDAVLVHVDSPCTGSEEAVVLAAIKDDKGAVRIAGVFVQSETCGE